MTKVRVRHKEMDFAILWHRGRLQHRATHEHIDSPEARFRADVPPSEPATGKCQLVRRNMEGTPFLKGPESARRSRRKRASEMRRAPQSSANGFGVLRF